MAQGRQKREEELDRQQDELERAYHRVADLKKYHESVVESLRTAIIVTDRNLLITSANEAATSNFGLSEQSHWEAPSRARLGLDHRNRISTSQKHTRNQ